MTRKRKDHLGLQPILPKPEKAALLIKTDCVPFYFNLPHVQQIVKQNDLQINHSNLSDQFGKYIKTCKTSKTFCDKCKCINCDNIETHSNCKSTINCTKELFISGITHPECIVSENSQCTENIKDENNCFLDKFYYNDKGNDMINNNINNISSLKKTSSQLEYTNELGNSSIIYNFNQEERENVHAYKSSSLMPKKQFKLSAYKNESTILDAFVKIAPCLPETLNKSRNFFTIKRNGKNKLVLNNKVKKILKFVPPNYCNNDRCCPNLLEMLKSSIAKDNFLKENLQNLTEQKIFNSNNFNNLKTHSVCNDDEGNLSKTFKANEILNANYFTENNNDENDFMKEKIVANQKEFPVHVNDFINGLESRRKKKEIFNVNNTRYKNIQFNKYCNKNVNTTEVNHIENRKIFSSFNIDLQSKTVAILKKYRKIAPRTKQINNSNDLEHYQDKIKTENYTLDHDINYISEQKEYFKMRDKIKLNELNNFEKLKSSSSYIFNKNKNTICDYRKYQKQDMSKNNINTIFQVCNEGNDDRFIDSNEEFSKVHEKNDLFITDKNSLQKLSFSELIKLSEKFGDRIFHLLSLDEITRKAIVELIEHNISSNTENIGINYDFIINNSYEKADTLEKNLYPFTYKLNQIDSLSCNSYIKIIPEITNTLKLKNINKEEKKIINFQLSSNNYMRTECEKKTSSEYIITKNKMKFLKFLDLYHIDEKINNKVNLNLLQNKGMINLKNPLIPLHRISKLIKYFKKKESSVSSDKSEDDLYSFGLMLEYPTCDSDILAKQSDASVENSIGGGISCDGSKKRKRTLETFPTRQ